MTEQNKPMPHVSEEFMEWLKSVPIPELCGFILMDGEMALKQIGYAQGILHLKRLINQKYNENQKRVLALDTKMPE